MNVRLVWGGGVGFDLIWGWHNVDLMRGLGVEVHLHRRARKQGARWTLGEKVWEYICEKTNSFYILSSFFDF